MGSDVVLTVHSHRPNAEMSGGASDDIIVGFARTVTLPWLMLFDCESIAPQEDSVPQIVTAREAALVRYRQRMATVIPLLDFVPDASRLFANFDAYLSELEPPWLSMNVWELWIADLGSTDNATTTLRAIEARLSGSIALLDEPPAATSDKWLALLDWTHPARTDPNYWLATHKTGLFGWPSVQGPTRPWAPDAG